jgi:copper chaperone CopZ
MCSKAVLNALQKVPFVEKVSVDIENQEYQLSFKKDASVDLDALSAAVDDAGFSVAKLTVTAHLDPVTLDKDKHVQIGSSYFHFLNAANQHINGDATFTIVDKQFTSAREYKKFKTLSKMPCVETGRMAKCCTNGTASSQTRVYHAII